MDIFTLISKRHDAIVKSAGLGAKAVSWGMGAVKKAPMAMLGLGFGAMDVAAGVKNGVRAAHAPVLPMNTFHSATVGTV